ncbi:MAG: ABC transporter ATP-binding protein, partial [Chloroflexi bacterium]
MISIALSHASLVLGGRSIFQDLTWEIQDRQKIGLIGPNGAGKTSLFKIITGEYVHEPGGNIVFAKGIFTGYLPQQPELDPGLTAYEAALQGNPRYGELLEEFENIEERLGDPAVYNNPSLLSRTIDRQQTLLDEYAGLGGDSYPGRVLEILSGLGLDVEDFDQPIGAMSGGQKKLIGLARLILLRPPVLLLDEPDNHLDLAGKCYLERLIQEYEGTIVIVSHDRYLLDAVVTHIAELEDGKLKVFEGDYSGYVIDKQERLARQEELFRVQQRSIARLEVSIKRLMYWAKQFDNEKFAVRARSMQNRLDKMDRIERPMLERRRMGFEINGWRGSNKVLELKGISKSFPTQNGNLEVLTDIDLLIRHGERVGLIGANGAGKSVLLRLILGSEEPTSGSVTVGPSVKLGYYAQEHETLDFNQTLINTVRYAGEMSESRAVAFLLRYLFTYNQSLQKIGELSGGERSRLQLALLVLSGANFLLLDEPT